MAERVRAGFFGHDDNRSIAVRRWMIEATKDDDGDPNYAAAMMLAQITWWTQPDERSGKTRAGHVHGSDTWLVRSDDEWITELGMSPRSARRSRNRLSTLGLIESKTLVDGGVRCTHLRRLPLDDEASTIRPDMADPEPQPSDGSGPMREPVLAESRARASSSSSREVEESGKPPLAERDPELAEAISITQAFWDYCHEHDIPRPSIEGGNPFIAVARMIKTLRSDGWEVPEIKQALLHTRVFTLAGLSFTLREARERSGPREVGSNPHFVRY